MTKRRDGTSPAATGGPPGDSAEGMHRTELRAANTQLLVSGPRGHEAAAHLRRQLALTIARIDNLAEGVCALDRAFSRTFANPAAERLLGLPEAEILGHDARVQHRSHATK